MHYIPEYLPKQEIIDKYAQVLINFALNSGEGVKAGEVVEVVVPDVAKPMALALQNAILQAGAHPIIRLDPTGFEKDYFSKASDEQLTFFPHDYLKAKSDLLDHRVQILADPEPESLLDISPHKIIKSRNSHKLFRDWLNEKENRQAFTWTLGLWGVEAKAKKVGLSLEEYWQQIIQACYLDQADPISKWRSIATKQLKIRQRLDQMKIQSVHVTGPDADIRVKLGSNRAWNGGSGRNIPSFEIFTSPDWRGTEGWMKFNEPVYRFGNIIQGVYLEFKDGKLIKSGADKGQEFLKEMLRTKDADKLGEFSLTDSRMSRITHPMAETLFDENMGGDNGNCHLAVGMAYKDCYQGDPSQVSQSEWEQMGYNDSAEHCDFVSTIERQVTAVTEDGSEVKIYSNGKFVV